MEVILFFIALIPVALLILAVTNASRLSDVKQQLSEMRIELERLRRVRSSTAAAEAKTTAERTTQDKPPATQQVQSPPVVTPEKPKVPAPTPVPQTVPRPRVVTPTGERQHKQKSLGDRWGDWVKRNPDLEKFIGENLMNKIGIAVFVIGMGLLLRLAIGRNLIDEVGRVVIGMLSGGILMFIAHRTRITFRAFSSVLIAGGISIFYFTFGIAFHQYQLIGQLPTFIIMIVITALAVVFSVLYDRKELAILSLIGGFATPFIASTGTGNYVVLFTYLLILNTGMLLLSEKKKWGAINMISLGLTWVVFGAWVSGDFTAFDVPPVAPGMLFASAFFLIFFAMNLRYDLKHGNRMSYLQYALILLNTGVFYALGYQMLLEAPVKLTGLFTALIGLFYLLCTYFLRKDERLPIATFYLLIGLILTFVSLVAPVQLDGNHITLFWAAEGVLLTWLAEKSGLTMLRKAAVGVAALMLISWFMDLAQLYNANSSISLLPFANRGFITGIGVVLSFWGILHFTRRYPTAIFKEVDRPLLISILSVLAIGSLFITGFLEIEFQLEKYFIWPSHRIGLFVYTALFIIVLETQLRGSERFLRQLIFAALLGCLVFLVSFGYHNAREAISGYLYEGVVHPIWFHWASVMIAMVVVFRISQIARELIIGGSQEWQWYMWGICTILVFLASQQLDIVMLGFGDLQERGIRAALYEFRKAGYPILWGIGSFVFMYYGMRNKLKTIRVIALVFFGITIAKLFLHDMSGASEGGRVAAFICLGILLLVVSFMYQKLKDLLLDDKSDTTTV